MEDSLTSIQVTPGGGGEIRRRADEDCTEDSMSEPEMIPRRVI